jgi:hypothetical protein
VCATHAAHVCVCVCVCMHVRIIIYTYDPDILPIVAKLFTDGVCLVQCMSVCVCVCLFSLCMYAFIRLKLGPCTWMFAHFEEAFHCEDVSPVHNFLHACIYEYVRSQNVCDLRNFIQFVGTVFGNLYTCVYVGM